MFGSTSIAAVFALWYFVVGALTGCISGLLITVIFKGDKGGVWKDALLGGLGMVLGFLLVAFVPVPENTITYKIGETTVTDTMTRFQHPYYIAFTLAVALPTIRAIRSARRRAFDTQR